MARKAKQAASRSRRAPPSPAARPPRSREGRAYRRARQDRGAETRARLIQAGLDVFGHQGFEAASTREIAKAANVNLAAILYHFGSKEALYRAVAEHIVEGISARLGTAIATAQSELREIDAESARKLILKLIEAFVDTALGNPEAERWARFVVREQLDPTPAFDIIYRFMGPAHMTLTRLVAAALGGDPESAEMKLKAFTILGQGLVFRIAPTLVARQLGTPALGATEREAIRRILKSHVIAILTMGAEHGEE
jgi:AcrR family transcriptional regulator